MLRAKLGDPVPPPPPPHIGFGRVQVMIPRTGRKIMTEETTANTMIIIEFVRIHLTFNIAW